jgi:NAD(P)-dependent dehydrogenase (short-subunit alcohol dehydrogenase family)
MNLLDAHKSLAGKRAVVIGGAFGIGREVTLALAGSGVDVALCDNDLEALKTIPGEVEALGRKVLAVPADVCDVAALDAFYDKVEAFFPAVDIIVNLAGGVKRNGLFETTREENAADIRRNYGYVIDSFRRGVPLIRKGGKGGSIVSFTTIEAHRGAATLSVYAGAKAATTNFSKAMALELGKEGIRVNIIAPDTTPARGSYSSIPEAELQRITALGEDFGIGMEMYLPLKVSPEPEDLAGAVLFLASDLARRITGIVLHVDSGTMAAAGFIDWPFGDGHMPAPLSGTAARLLGRDAQRAAE